MFARSIAVAFLAWSLGLEAAAGAPSPKARKTVKIGVVADVTGVAGAYGTSQKNAFDIATADLATGRIDAGGTPVAFDVRDSASIASQAANAMRAFASGGAALLIGPTLSREAKIADPVAIAAGLTVLATSSAAIGVTSLGPCVFRDALTEAQIVPETVDRTVAKWRAATAAIVYGDDNPFTRQEFDLFKAALERRHVRIVDVETYRTGDDDFRTQLERMSRKKPDVIVVGALLDDAVRIVVQARQRGMNNHLVGGGGLNSPKFVQLAGEAGEGVVIGTAYFVGNSYAGNREFVERYKQRFGTSPDQFSAQAYAAAQIAAAAVRAGATAPRDFCSAFQKLAIVQTVLGPVNFSQGRDLRAASATVQISKGEFAYFS